MRLRQKLLFIIIPLMLLPILLIGLITFVYNQESKKALAQVKAQRDTTNRVAELTHLKDNMEAALIYLAREPYILSHLTQPNEQLLDNIRRSFKDFNHAYQEVSEILLLDRDKRFLFSYLKSNENLALDLISAPDKQWVIKPNVSLSTPTFSVLWPIYPSTNKDNSEPLGFIQLKLDADITQHLNLNSDFDNKLFITDRRGNIVFSYPAKQIGGQLPDYMFAKLLEASKNKTAVEVTMDGQEIFMSGDFFTQQYLFFYGQPPESYHQDTKALAWLMPLVVLLSVLFAAGLIVASINRLIISPISKLAKAKQQVAQGNLDIKLNVTNRDEIAELFSSFNIMVKQLEVYREKERDSRLRLEYKVKERTEDLESANKELEIANVEMEQAKQISEQANELKSAFVANMSHEIRTPLTAILGFTEQVIADSPRTPQQLDLLGRVLNSGKHLLSLINNILDLSKIESGKVELEITTIDMFDLFNDVASIMSNQANDSQLQFEFNYHYPLPRQIRTDSTRLRQVLFNLASNAIKFTEEGSVKVDISYQQESKQIEIKVIDTGIGISEEVLEYIFEPFTQADVSISRRFGGTGLGLVVSKSFANLLGGDIQVSSEVGEGSIFTFSFAITADQQEYQFDLVNSVMDLVHKPIETINLPEPKHEEDSKLNKQGLKGRVLVAEDVEDNQYLFKLLLRNLGVDYVMVANGEQAVEKALEEDFDLILMDMQMPVMGGLEATELLRMSGVETPIYALTANVMKEDMQQHLDVGCDGTIAKPVDRSEFTRVVKKVLDGKQEHHVEGISASIMEQLTQKYLKQLHQQVIELNKHIYLKDGEGLRGELHKIKGSAGNYGFMDLSKMSAELELECKQSLASTFNWPEMEQKVNALIQAIGKVCHAENSKATS